MPPPDPADQRQDMGKKRECARADHDREQARVGDAGVEV
jgi:hypothetical protein